MLRRTLLLALFVPVLMIACGRSGAGTDPEPPRLAKVAIISGDRQRAPAYTELPEPLVVKLTDKDGKPIPGIRISWYDVWWVCSFGSGKWNRGTFSPNTSVTDANGIAQTRYTMAGPGPYSINTIELTEEVEPDVSRGGRFQICSLPTESSPCDVPGPDGPRLPC